MFKFWKSEEPVEGISDEELVQEQIDKLNKEEGNAATQLQELVEEGVLTEEASNKVISFFNFMTGGS